MSGGKVVKEEHKNAPHAKESSKNGKFKHKGQLKKQNTMKQEEDLFDLTFDLTLAVIRKRGDGRITSIQPYESQGERTICVSYDEQQARISIIIHQNDIQIRCSFTFTSFVQTFEYVFDDKMTKKQKEKILGILLDNALQNGNGTNEEILFTIN